MENKNFKNKIGIVADEGGDLPEELIKEHQISIVPFKVDLGEMRNIPGNIYQKIREAEKRGVKSFIKTSQPSPGDFLNAFKEKLKNFEEVICLTITSKHSGTYNSAIQAREFLPEKEKIHIVDSLNGSGGEGLIILKVASLIKQNLEIKEILEKLKEVISKTHLIALLEDPKWIEASGRIPRFIGLGLKGAKKFGILPFLVVKKGRISPVLKKKAKGISETLFEEFKKRISKINSEKIMVAITHADNEKEAIKLKEMIKEVKKCQIIFLNLIGNILGGLAGPGTVALSWQI